MSIYGRGDALGERSRPELWTVRGAYTYDDGLSVSHSLFGLCK